MIQVYPLLLDRIIPVFVKQDARKLESLLWDCYRAQDNYKFQGMSLWIGTMAVEQALLELMGQTSKRPVADFFGGRQRDEIPIYVASGTRGNKPEEEVEHLKQLVAESGAKALKFRLGGRMNRNVDSLPGRTEALIPMVRKAFGDQFVLYADSNSSYDAPEAIRIGRIMEEYKYDFYEEPVEFDDLWGCKAVADELTIPIALGEQEFSEHRFRWCIANRVADIMQPDLHYYGGFIRSHARRTHGDGGGNESRAAHVRRVAGLPRRRAVRVVDAQHRAVHGVQGQRVDSCVLPDISLKSDGGIVKVPTGPGFGVTLDPDFVAKAQPVTVT
jgi:L-alanine-DL-glutamate epimerase-like enolase superfamily enzyme